MLSFHFWGLICRCNVNCLRTVSLFRLLRFLKEVEIGYPELFTKMKSWFTTVHDMWRVEILLTSYGTGWPWNKDFRLFLFPHTPKALSSFERMLHATADSSIILEYSLVHGNSTLHLNVRITICYHGIIQEYGSIKHGQAYTRQRQRDIESVVIVTTSRVT